MRPITVRLALLAAALVSLLAPASALGIATAKQIEEARDKGVEYLEAQQKESGEIAGFGGDWALTSLAASGVAAADVNLSGKEGKDARSWYEGLVGNPAWPGEGAVSTDFERAALASYAAGIDPARVSKRQNLFAKVASYYQPESPGYYGSTFNATVFGLLVLADVKTTGGAKRVPQIVLDQAVEAIKANQHTDGGWTWEKAAGNEAALKKPSEPDMTGAAMAAMCAAGVEKTNASIEAAKAYLVAKFVKASGAFESAFGVNTNANAWAVDGLKECGIDPQGAEFTGSAPNFRTPINFLINQQLAGGGFKYLTTDTKANFYASQDAVRALGSGGFTAVPPTPSSGPQWKGATEFATGESESTSLALVINDGVSALKVCSVTLAPKATTTTLAKVLDAAVAGTTPAGCVSGYLPGSGEAEPITQVNGYPTTPTAGWEISIDGGAETQAKRNTPINVGDTIYLKY
jgi:hypothetical protein